MWLRRILFLVVATLVLLYLGHFAINALVLAFSTKTSGASSRMIDLVLLPISAALAWWIMTRLTPGEKRPTGRRGPPPEPPS